MNKHELALQHAMKALILIQDELVSKLSLDPSQPNEASQGTLTNFGQPSKRPEDRLIVLCIAYHNIAVEQEFLK